MQRETRPPSSGSRNWFGSISRIPLFVWLLLKVLLRKILLVLFLSLRTAFRYKVSSALIGLLLVALIWTNARSPAPRSVSAMGSGEPSLAAPPAVESYIKGQGNFDANLMWKAMSERFQQRIMAQGGSIEGLQQQLDAARAQGRQFKDVKYIAGYRLNDGRTIHLYVIDMEVGGELVQIPYLFTVDRGGKIDNID